MHKKREAKREKLKCEMDHFSDLYWKKKECDKKK
jgi:hypothetical protein